MSVGKISLCEPELFPKFFLRLQPFAILKRVIIFDSFRFLVSSSKSNKLETLNLKP